MSEVLAAGSAPAISGRRRLSALAAAKFDQVALAIFGLLALLVLVKPVARGLHKVPLDYNEGWNAYFAMRALDGAGALYPDPASLITNNYPPLSFYVVGGLARLLGDPIFAGRLVALASFLVVAVNVALATRALSRSGYAQAFACALFAGSIGVVAPGYVAMNDPHWLGLALTTSALVVLLRSGTGPRALFAAAALMLAGGLVKHMLIALPLAVTLWLSTHDRRRFRAWIALGAVSLAVALSALWLVYGGAAFAGILGTPRPFSPAWLVRNAALACAPLAPLAACAILYFIVADREPRARLLVWYAVVALAWGVFCLGGDGVDVNAVFDAVVAAAIASAALIGRLEALPMLAGVPCAVVRTAVVLVAGLSVITGAPAQLGLGRSFARIEAEHRQDIAFIGAIDGPVLCENLSLCFWAGRPFEVDVFNTGNKLRAGGIDEHAVIAAIARHQFGAIQIGMPGDRDFGAASTPRLPAAVNAAIARSYKIARVSRYGGVVLVPRRDLP